MDRSLWRVALIVTLGAVVGGSASAVAQSTDPNASPSPSATPAPTATPAPVAFHLYGGYEVIMQAGAGPLMNEFRFDGSFTLSGEAAGGAPSQPSDTPDGTGIYLGRVGQFQPGQTQCGPIGMRSVRDVIDIVATVEGGRLGVWIVPHPPASDPLLDVFNTRFSPLEAGAKHFEVPLSGGSLTWGGGTVPMKIECDGIQPASGGWIVIDKLRGP
jgi:hypothetical protein